MITKDETTVLKGIAILMVFMQHIGQAFHVNIVNPLGPIGVFLFLFLSGYGLTCSYLSSGRKRYFIKKFKKIYMPYAFTIILFLIAFFINNEFPERITILRYFCLLSLPQGSYWFMVFLAFWYIVFYVITYVFDNDILLIFSLVLASIIILYIQKFSPIYVWQFASFPIGVYVTKHQVKWENAMENLKNPGGYLLVICSAILVIIKKTSYVESHELGVVDNLLQIGITWCIGLWILIFVTQVSRFNTIKRTCAWIGRVSYELYLAHIVPLDYLKSNPSFRTLIYYLGISFLCMIVIKIFEKGFYGLNNARRKFYEKNGIC